MRLVSARASPLIAGELCAVLSESCLLSKISLSKVGLTDANVKDLCAIISGARFLVDFDISWNKFTPHSMLLLTECVAENRKLKFLNLSWNLMTSSHTVEDEILTIEDDDSDYTGGLGNRSSS